MKILTTLFVLSMMASCIHPKVKFRKSALLDPMMSPSSTQSMATSVLAGEATIGVEKGSIGGDNGGLGSDCPTCG